MPGEHVLVCRKALEEALAARPHLDRDAIVRADSGLALCDFDRLAQTPQLVAQADLKGLLPRPDPALAHEVDLLVLLAAPLRGLVHEVLVETLHLASDRRPLCVGVAGVVAEEIGVLSPLDLVAMNPQPVLVEPAHVELSADDPDGPGDRRGLGHDP